MGCDAWDDLLLAVIAAPRRSLSSAPDATALSPEEQCRALLRQFDPAQCSIELARLVTGLWIVNDPMTVARRRGLHKQIAHDYEWLAGYSRQDRVQRYRQNAHRHRRLAGLRPWT